MRRIERSALDAKVAAKPRKQDIARRSARSTLVTSRLIDDSTRIRGHGAAAKRLATQSSRAYINARLTGMRVGTEVAKRGGL
ncbi:MAG TPA: hypothetical protein VNP98_14050 [Chthoniobacterales bacterium]|nr:hypothetical protein [Chthoniobacterales bacterium]